MNENKSFQCSIPFHALILNSLCLKTDKIAIKIDKLPTRNKLTYTQYEEVKCYQNNFDRIKFRKPFNFSEKYIWE